MLGLDGSLPTASRTRLAVIATLAMITGLVALTPSAAHAAGCEDSWTNTAGGSWFEGSNWSNNAPPKETEEACISTSGTYTVEMAQKSTVTVKSLTVGGVSGTQTLVIASTNSLNAVLTTSAGITNGTHGAITLTNAETNGNNVTVVSPINNAGTITTEPAHGGSRTIQGSLTNTGTLAINANTAYNGEKAVLTNEGSLNIPEAKLTVSNKGSVTNGANGEIAAGITSGLQMEPETTFTEGAGTTSGTRPVVVRDAALKYTGSGASLIAQHGESSTLSGNISAGQSLVLESTNGEHTTSTAAASFTNAGTITLTNSETNANNAKLVISSGTLTNSGTITTEKAIGGQRTLTGNLTNTSTGTLAINANTAYNGASALLTNKGAINIATGIQLIVSNDGSVTNTSGKIVAGENADVLLEPGSTFTEGAGTTSGTKPVILRDAALKYTGLGKSLITQHGESGTLSGNISAGQSLVLESTNGEHTTSTAATGFTNAGTITLTNSETNANNARLVISSGTLTNSGKIITEAPVGGTRTLQGNITNTGTLSIKTNTIYNGEKATLTNEGALSVAEGKTLTVSNDGSVTNGAGGNIAAGATGLVQLESGSAFTQGAGTTTGIRPVVIRDGSLDYAGTGASTIAQHGESSTLSGNISAGQSLVLESTNGEHVTSTAATGFTNAGTITLTNSETNANNARLVISSGTLTNSGKIITEAPVGGTRTLQGNITNTGTLSIKTNTIYNGAGDTLTNEGALNIAEGATFTATGAATVTNGSGGSIFAPGSALFSQSGGTFNEGAGEMIGTEPVVLDDLTLNYGGTSTEHGAGRIGLRGASTLSGNVKAHEILALESTCSEHAVVTAMASFLNAGKIELTNGDSCTNNATLNMKGGTLTNTNTLVAAKPRGGARALEGNLVNSGTVVLAAGETLQVSGTFTQEPAGSLKTRISSASSFGSMSVAGTATVAGTLIVFQVSPFKASLGQTYNILTSSSLTGTFAATTGDQVNSTGLYYQPTYSATGVTLLVTQATLVLTNAEGAPGSTVTLSGSGYLPGDTITPTFTDHKGVSTVFPSVTTNSSGEFSTEITIPASAAPGKGTIKTTSTRTNVNVSDAFKVT